MALYRVFKETALPGTLVADAVYFITDPNVAYVQIYVTSTAGVARRIHTQADIENLITTAISNAANTRYAADITARNALPNLTVGTTAYVSDATGDVTVSGGAASYIVKSIGPVVWEKTTEFESLDVALTWAALQNKPTSSVAAIDSAVSASHSHANLTTLNQLADLTGQLTYNGTIVKTEWSSLGW